MCFERRLECLLVLEPVGLVAKLLVVAACRPVVLVPRCEIAFFLGEDRPCDA